MKRNRELPDREVDALLRVNGAAAGQLAAALTLLRGQGAGDPPAPTGALVALLRDGLVATPLPLITQPARPRRGLRATLVAVGAGGGLLLAATGANALPAAGQRAIAGLINEVTPFHFPMPAQPAQVPVQHAPVKREPVSPAPHGNRPSAHNPEPEVATPASGGRSEQGRDDAPAEQPQPDSGSAPTGDGSTAGSDSSPADETASTAGPAQPQEPVGDAAPEGVAGDEPSDTSP